MINALFNFIRMIFFEGALRKNSKVKKKLFKIRTAFLYEKL